MSSVAIKDNSEIKTSINTQVAPIQIENPIVEDESASMLQLLESLTQTLESSTVASKRVELNASEFLTEKKASPKSLIQEQVEAAMALSDKIAKDPTGQVRLDALKDVSAKLSVAYEESLKTTTSTASTTSSTTQETTTEEINVFKQKTSSSYALMALALGSLSDHVCHAEEELSIQTQFKSENDLAIGKQFEEESVRQQSEIEKELIKIEDLMKKMEKAAKDGAIWGYVMEGCMVFLACVTMQPELAIMAIGMAALTVPVDGKVGGKGALAVVSESLSKELQNGPCHMSKSSADIMASAIIIVVLGLLTLGAGVTCDMAYAGTTTASTVAEEGASEGLEIGTSEAGAAAPTTNASINSTSAESFASRLTASARSAKNTGTQSAVQASTMSVDGFWGKLAEAIDGGNSDLLIALEVIGVALALLSGLQMSRGLASSQATQVEKTTSTAAKAAAEEVVAAQESLMSRIGKNLEELVTSSMKSAYKGASYAFKTPISTATMTAQVLAFIAGIMEAKAAGELGAIHEALGDEESALTKASANLALYQTSLNHMDSDASTTSALIAEIGKSLTAALQQGLSYQQTLSRLLA